MHYLIVYLLFLFWFLRITSYMLFEDLNPLLTKVLHILTIEKGNK